MSLSMTEPVAEIRHRINANPEIEEVHISSPTSSTSNNIEQQETRTYSTTINTKHDPYTLKRGLKTEEELTTLKSNRRKKNKGNFYEKQNSLIGNLLRPLEEHIEDAKEMADSNALPVKIAIYASLIANICLSALQLFAVIKSGSLSLLATAVDSVMDPLSNLLLWVLHRKAKKLDLNKWPVGGSRLSTIGDICYGSLNAAINLVVCVESIRAITSHKKDDPETTKIFIPGLVAVGVALGVKIGLFFLCGAYKKHSSQVAMLYEDHRNDLFVNTFGILMSAGGSKLKWFMDPLGGFLIAFGVILAWVRTIYHGFELLAGKSAPNEFLQLIIYKAVTFSDEIQKIDTVRAYHSGPNLFVEVDIVMSGETPLWKAHDLSQQLQDKIELLPGVGRVFVHVDYETTHKPEHRKPVE